MAEENSMFQWNELFFKEYVSKNMPVVVRGAAKTLCKNALKWNSHYFMEKFKDKEVTVALTPNGYADGLNSINGQEYFILPEERRMTMKTFLELLMSKK